MTSFEFGTTPPAEPVVDWDELFRARPPAGEDQAEPPPCDKECCAGQRRREGGGLL